MVIVSMHTDFSGGRLGDLVFPSLSEVSIPHSEKLWHSQ